MSAPQAGNENTSPLKSESTAPIAGPALTLVTAMPGTAEGSTAYRRALREAVAQTRATIPDPLDRLMHFDAIAKRLGEPFGVFPRVVSDSLRSLEAQAARAAHYAPGVEWLGLEDRDRLASTLPRYLVTDYLFADAAIHILYGVPGSRKTFLALSWLLALSAGRPWAGRFPVQPGGVLFFAGEAAATLRVRRAAGLAALGITPEEAAGLPFGVVPELPPLGSPDGVDAVLQLVESHYRTRHADVPLRVIALDTLTRLSQRAQSSTTDAKEYGILLDRVDQIAHATGASIVLLAHSPESSPDKPTGTYQTRGNADSVMKIERVDNRSSRLTVEKAKDDIEGTPLLLQFGRKDVRQWLAASYQLEGRPFPSPLADALAVRDFDSSTDVLPTDADLAGEDSDPVRAARDAALRRQFTSLVLTEARSDAPRANGRSSRDAQVEQHILEWLGRHPGESSRGLRDSFEGQVRRVDQAVARLLDRGLVEDRGSPSRRAFHLAKADKVTSDQAA